jgi:hypothetical protein
VYILPLQGGDFAAFDEILGVKDVIASVATD